MYGLYGIQNANEERAAEMRLVQFKKAQAFDRLQEYHVAQEAAYRAYQNAASSDAYGMADLVNARYAEWLEAMREFNAAAIDLFAEGRFDGK